MTQFKWAKGYHAPKGISAEEVGAAFRELSDRTPSGLFEASKRKRHILHSHLWAEGDQVWANRARVDECRHIIGAVRAVFAVGGAEISVRAVEFLRENGDGRWADIEEIVADPSLHDAYMSEIQRLQEQAVNKMQAFRILLKDHT